LCIQAHINHIIKIEFFLAFHAAYNAVMTKENISGGFQGAGLVPFDLQAVIFKLDIKLQTPTPAGPSDANAYPWVF
jgi:hypothetical protein